MRQSRCSFFERMRKHTSGVRDDVTVVLEVRQSIGIVVLWCHAWMLEDGFELMTLGAFCAPFMTLWASHDIDQHQCALWSTC